MNRLPALRLSWRVFLQRPAPNRPLYRPSLPSHSLRMASNSPAPAPRFAEGEDPQQLGSDTVALQQQGWTLDTDGMGVTKTFYFKSYFKAAVSSLWMMTCVRLTGAVFCQFDCVREFNEEAPSHYDYSTWLPEYKFETIQLTSMYSASGRLIFTGPPITRAASLTRTLRWLDTVTMELD